MLELKYKEIPKQAQKAMQNAVASNINYYDVAIDEIRKIQPAKTTYILNSADSCIFTITEAIDGKILVANEGGWNGLQRSAEILNKKVEEITTNNGLIEIEKLDDYLNTNDIKALYITALAAYTAIQPIKEIYEICNKHDVLLILDISGLLSDNPLLQNCDIQIASCGSPKIVNIENGGFINDLTNKINLNKHLLKTFKVDNVTCAGIAEEIKNSTKTLEKSMNATRYIKNKLITGLENDEIHRIIHPDSEGINIIITEESRKKAKNLSYNIRQELSINNNKSIITTGPNYNRLKQACIAIEIKNLDTSCLTKENMDKLTDIILKNLHKKS